MKLRNKKTGEIVDLDEWCFDTYDDKLYIARGDAEGDNIEYFNSLEDLCSKYEDYTSPEPLIKDEKIRKAVRAWLAIQDQPIVAAAITCNKDSDGFFNYCLYGYIEKARISNGKPVVNNNLTAIDFEFRSLEKMEFERRRDYTIAELCGEEEE